MDYIITYDFEPTLNCGKIIFNDKCILLDFTDLFKIINNNKKFLHYTEDKLYPYFYRNQQKITFRDFIFNYKEEDVCYKFLNNNCFDLRKENIKIFHKYHYYVKEKYNIISYIEGHIKNNGKDGYKIKNPLWKIKENNKEYLLMYCEKDTLCKLCPQSYEKILHFEKNNNNNIKLTFYKHSNGYIATHKPNLFIHQIITGCYGNGKGTKNISVDHIDQDPLNNTFDNLRIVSQKIQQQNTTGTKEGTKRERKSNAKSLPDGINQDMLKKYVTYNKECYNKEKKLYRDFFRVDHPKLDKQKYSSKSEKVPILEKLAQANKIVEDLDKGIYISQEKKLPLYVSKRIHRDREHFIFDKKTEDGQRLNLKMILPEEYDLNEQISIFNEKIKNKYNIEIV